MIEIWLYTLASVIIISLISLIGIITIPIKVDKLKNTLIYMISFSAGALLADAFIHLLPEAIKESGLTLTVSLSVLAGIAFSFIVEKFIHWRHCHLPITKHHVHPFSIMSLFGDTVHNFIDGLIIGASYLASIPTGIATTIAVIFHEIPQEMSDFGVLVHGGFSKGKALFWNFITSLTAVLGAIIALVIGSFTQHMTAFLVPFAAGGFIYIASSDLIPELHKETEVKKSVIQLAMFILGIAIMVALLFFG
jgi:zinc and cadmium transporter